MGCHSSGMIKGLQGDFNPEGLCPCVYLSIYLFFPILPILLSPHQQFQRAWGWKALKYTSVFRISVLENPRESSFIRLPSSWKNPPPPPHPIYHPITTEIGVEIFKMYNRIYNQQTQTHLSNKFYPYHHLIKCPLPLPRSSPPSRG